MNLCCPQQPCVGRWKGSYEARQLLKVLLWVADDEGRGKGGGRLVLWPQWRMVEVRMVEVMVEVRMVEVKMVKVRLVEAEMVRERV